MKNDQTPTNIRIKIENEEVIREDSEERGRTQAKNSVILTTRMQEKSKEILSPTYKPFEIFFKYRRNSPYVSHRS